MKKWIAAIAPLALVLTLGLGTGCQDPEQLAGIEEKLGEIDTKLAAIEKKLDEVGKAQPAQRAQNRPAIDPKDALAKIGVKDVPARGADAAVVTIVEYSDFQCPYCKKARPTLKQILDTYGTQVRHVFKHFPLSFHRQAINAHKAVASAREQGKFWEMHDLIFEDPGNLSPEKMREHAATLGLDLEAYDEAYASERIAKVIEDDQKEGRSVGVRGTPAFFVNGKYMAGAQPFEAFKREIDAALAAEKKDT